MQFLFKAGLIFFLSFAFSKVNVPGDLISKWVIEKNSTINIKGETNVNHFQCDITQYLTSDTLFCVKNGENNNLSFTQSSISINIKRFDCHNSLITDNFRSSLKANQWPMLKIVFLSLEQFSNSYGEHSVKGLVDIELAHSIKRTEINCILKVLPENRLCLSGSQTLQFSSFKLEPPEKLFGMIRTKDEVKVNFQLFLKII